MVPVVVGASCLSLSRKRLHSFPLALIDAVVNYLNLEPKIDAMIRDFLDSFWWKELSKETGCEILPSGDGSRGSMKSTVLRKSLRCWIGSSDRSPWNEHSFCTNRMVLDRRGTTLFPTGSSMVFDIPRG
ncbi:hypothetical protein Tco_1199712 [Tanacetum coccineum]